MSDRISELLRQKKLLQEHLGWLDQEIARAASGRTEMPAPAQMSPAPSPAQPAPTAPFSDPPAPAVSDATEQLAAGPTIARPPEDHQARTAEAMRMADEIIARYQDDALRPEDTKRGCLVLAGIVFVLMGAAFLVSWWLFYRSHM